MKAEDQSAEREAFEKWAREEFVCHEYSFAIAQPYGYINTIQSKTFAGRVNAQYADVQMLWLTWRGARAALSAREAPAPGIAQKVALDIAKWIVQGDTPDEWKLKEWAESLDRDAIGKAYDWLEAGRPQAPTTEGSET